MRQAAAETSELFDAVGGFGDGADWCLVERRFDYIGVAGQFADGSDDAPTPQTIEAAIAISDKVAMHRGPAHTRNLACLRMSEP